MELPDAKALYRKNMVIEVDGEKRVGSYLAPAKQRYAMRAYLKGKPDALTILSCYRDIYVQNPVSPVDFGYAPDAHLEASDCPLYLETISRSGQAEWAVIDFESPLDKLVATLKCNGLTKSHGGVSICHGRVGLLAQISFAVATRFKEESLADCGGEQVNQFTYRFTIPKKESCTVVFKSGHGESHRLTFYPYERQL